MKEKKKLEKKMQPCMTCGQDKKGEKKRECYNSHLIMKERRFTSLEKKEENVESLMYYSENCKEKKAGHLLVVL